VRRAPLFLFLCLAACGREPRELREWRPEDHQQPATEPEATGDPAEVEARAATSLFASMCAECHGADGRGAAPGTPDLTAAEVRGHTDQALAETLSAGRGLMPGFGDRLSPSGIDAMVRHVRRLGGS